jgi:hypothetical protein
LSEKKRLRATLAFGRKGLSAYCLPRAFGVGLISLYVQLDSTFIHHCLLADLQYVDLASGSSVCMGMLQDRQVGYTQWTDVAGLLD